MEDNLWWNWWKTIFDGREHFLEGNLWWKMTFNGRQHFNGKPLSREDNFWWKRIFDERWALMEDDLRWRMTFNGWQALMDDYLHWKTPLFETGSNELQALGKENLQWRTTFNWGYPVMKYYLWSNNINKNPLKKLPGPMEDIGLKEIINPKEIWEEKKCGSIKFLIQKY